MCPHNCVLVVDVDNVVRCVNVDDVIDIMQVFVDNVGDVIGNVDVSVIIVVVIGFIAVTVVVEYVPILRSLSLIKKREYLQKKF